MKHAVTSRVAGLALLFSFAVARSSAADASPFTEIPIASQPHHRHGLAYLSLGAGVAMVGGSFVHGNVANHAYADYLGASDPDAIERLWHRTVLNDRLSSGMLLAGDVLIATGLYLRFLAAPRAADTAGLAPGDDGGTRAAISPASRLAPLALEVRPGRCALAWRF